MFISLLLWLMFQFSEAAEKEQRNVEIFLPGKLIIKKKVKNLQYLKMSNLIDYFVLNDGNIEESIKKMENIIKKDKSKRGVTTDEN